MKKDSAPPMTDDPSSRLMIVATCEPSMKACDGWHDSSTKSAEPEPAPHGVSQPGMPVSHFSVSAPKPTENPDWAA